MESKINSCKLLLTQEVLRRIKGIDLALSSLCQDFSFLGFKPAESGKALVGWNDMALDPGTELTNRAQAFTSVDGCCGHNARFV